MSLAGILIFLGLGILLVITYPNLIIAEKIAQRPQPEMGEIRITRAILQITNRCPQPHHFRVSSDIKDTGFKQQTDVILVRAKANKKIEVLIDAMESAGEYTAAVKCLDCKKEEGCAQDSYEVPIQMVSAKITLKGETPGSARSASVVSTQSGVNDVGIIPENSGGCPVGSEHIYISMDDEDNNNASSVSGWTGDISHYSTGTTFGFCRVDGNQFHSLPGRDYAVLQLSSNCPTGSVSIFRVFDNEHNGNNNWASGNISPNTTGPPTKMSFCFFQGGNTPTMTSFPNFYVAYGVFAAPSLVPALPSGVVHTDDEDTGNADYTYSMIPGAPLNLFANIIYGTEAGTPLGGKNTNLLVAKVANKTPCTSPCPYIGSYDGANCWLGQPPAGTHAFTWSTNFYYTPVNGNQCPKPGSWYDGANCFVTAIPPQTSPFIWSNMWYVQPVCRP
jgi:hypothetical protein